MKKTENILGIIAVSLFVLGVIFKFMHWPGGNPAFGLSILIFNLGYFPLWLIRDFRKAGSSLEKTYLVFRFLTLFIAMFGFVFKIQHWPGAGLLLVLSTYLIPLFIVFYFYLRIRGKGALPFRWSDLILTVVAYLVFVFVTGNQVSTSVVNGYVMLEEQYSTFNAGIQTANELIYTSMDSAMASGNDELPEVLNELRDASQKIYHMCDTLRSGFISSFYDVPFGDSFDLATADRNLLASSGESSQYFIYTPRASLLKSALAGYMEQVRQINQRYHLPASLIGTGFELEDVGDPWGNLISWEDYMFSQAPIAAVLTSIAWIRQTVLLTERGMQNQLFGILSEKENFRMVEQIAMGESKLAMELKENEILRISQQRELERIQLENSQAELDQRNTIIALALAGIVFVMILLTITTRAFMLKQKDNKQLVEQRDEILSQRDEIEAQRDEIEAQRDMVSKQKEQIEKSHLEISASMDYAMRLQDTILPSLALLEEKFSGHMVFYRPKQKVSGDFYWWTRKGDELILAVADCTGHGVPGAFMSLLGAGLLKEIVTGEGITEPGKILDRLREEVIAALCQKGSPGEQKDGMEMAVVSINPESLECHYSGAKSPLYQIRRDKLMIHRPDQMPISWYEEMQPFDTKDVQLEAGDQLYMFSDGYADQFGGAERKKFNYKNFRKVLTEHSDLSMSRQQQVLSDTIREWQGLHEQIDDMVIVGIKI